MWEGPANRYCSPKAARRRRHHAGRPISSSPVIQRGGTAAPCAASTSNASWCRVREPRHARGTPWPHPETPEALAEVLTVAPEQGQYGPRQNALFSGVREESPQGYAVPQVVLPDKHSCPAPSTASPLAPADALFAKVRELLGTMPTPRTDAEVAADLCVLQSQAQAWLQRLVPEGVLEEHPDPVRYSRRHS